MKNTWNLKLLYKSPTDPQIDLDMIDLERAVSIFTTKYNTHKKAYLTDPAVLKVALVEFETLYAHLSPKALYYFLYQQSIDSDNSLIQAKMSLLIERVTKISNSIQFFVLALGAIPNTFQNQLLNDSQLSKYHYLLKCIFSDAKHKLSLSEEKVLALKKLPSRELWISNIQKLLGSRTVLWKSKSIPLAQASNLVSELKTPNLRKKLSSLIAKEHKHIAQFSEAEINAVFIDKKIDDELRGFQKPYESTVLEYRNDPEVIENLVKLVTDNFGIAHRFYKLKAKILNQKKLNYCDHAAKIDVVKAKYTFSDSVKLLKRVFGSIDPKYVRILDSMINDGRIDAVPRKGKQGGAYCSSAYLHPTFVLLNHIDTMYSLSTFAHEMGHAYHSELSRSQGPIYCEYSFSLAETASTLFEAMVGEGIFETLSDKEKIIVLHDQINDDIATIFRQIACFNFELELHQTIRKVGSVSKEDICAIHNKHMRTYLGSTFNLVEDNGYSFVSWSHIRRFFYVYSYAYGSLVSKALLRKYKQDPKFWKNIEKFLSSGGKDSPENILKDIGIDVKKPDFFMEGLKEIEDNITLLEKLTRKK